MAAAGAGVYYSDRVLTAFQRDLYRRLAEQKREIARLREANQHLEMYVRLVAVAERKGRIEVVDQRRGEKGVPLTTIRFTEVDAAGSPITAGREVTVTGREIYVDTVTIRFEEYLVEDGDPLKGRAVMLFRRVSSLKHLEEGLSVDVPGRAPQVYAGDESPNPFEANLWVRLWALAGNPSMPGQPGLRVIRGNAPYTRVEAGRTYEITLRPTGEVTIGPLAQKRK